MQGDRQSFGPSLSSLYRLSKNYAIFRDVIRHELAVPLSGALSEYIRNEKGTGKRKRRLDIILTFQHRCSALSVTYFFFPFIHQSLFQLFQEPDEPTAQHSDQPEYEDTEAKAQKVPGDSKEIRYEACPDHREGNDKARCLPPLLFLE
jgi:hypothetical protein